MIKTVYFKKEDMEVLEKIIKENPKFEFSEFVRNAMNNYAGINLENLDELYKKIYEHKLKNDYHNNEIIFLENKINKVKEQQEAEEEKKKEQEEYEKEQEKIDEFFRELTNEDWDQYKEGIKQGKWSSTKEFYKNFQGEEETLSTNS